MLGNMQPFSSLAELPLQLHHDAVRELAWTLLSPPLIETAACSIRHPLHASDWVARPDALADWLLQLDTQPDTLLAWLEQQPIRRLGHYYESLWQFALQAAPGVELLAHNLPIREGNQTLGELDLLLRDQEGVHHVELAVKFYLGVAEADGTARWWGPNPRDRLDLKLAHLCRHQLPLSGHPAARELLPEGPVRASFWMGGWLFDPSGGLPSGVLPSRVLPSGVDLSAQRCLPGHAAAGRWQPAQGWSPDAGEEWIEVPRLSWLAPLRRSGRPGVLLEPAELNQPRLLARLQEQADGSWHEVQRLFLLPNDWIIQTRGN